MYPKERPHLVIQRGQGKLKVLVLYLFFSGDRYGYIGIKYAYFSKKCYDLSNV